VDKQLLYGAESFLRS